MDQGKYRFYGIQESYAGHGHSDEALRQTGGWKHGERVAAGYFPGMSLDYYEV